MALRTFVDSTGAEWDAFDVIPRPDERRQYDRRTPEQRRLDAEDRRENDRRLTVGGGSPLVSGVVEGWLCFEHGVDRRRLSPIPDNWSRSSDAQLEAYCRSATPVNRTRTVAEPVSEPKR